MQVYQYSERFSDWCVVTKWMIGRKYVVQIAQLTTYGFSGSLQHFARSVLFACGAKSCSVIEAGKIGQMKSLPALQIRKPVSAQRSRGRVAPVRYTNKTDGHPGLRAGLGRRTRSSGVPLLVSGATCFGFSREE